MGEIQKKGGFSGIEDLLLAQTNSFDIAKMAFDLSSTLPLTTTLGDHAQYTARHI
jgi:hypothetical protein